MTISTTPTMPPMPTIMMRLDQRGERGDRDVDFFFVEVGDLVEHLIERAGLLTDRDHLHDHRRERPSISMRGSAMFLPSLMRWRAYMMALVDDHVAGGLGHDLERVENGDAGLEQSAERAGEARDRDLRSTAPMIGSFRIDPVDDRFRRRACGTCRRTRPPCR